MLKYKDDYSSSALAKTLAASIEERLPYVKYYVELQKHWRNNIQTYNMDDNNGRLGTYYQVNPQLKPWVPYPQVILESERKITTRFRTGSHSLNIEIMRYSNISRDNRLCACRESVQNIWHIFMECNMTIGIIRRNYANLEEIFDDENIHINLIKIANRLKIPLGRT